MKKVIGIVIVAICFIVMSRKCMKKCKAFREQIKDLEKRIEIVEGKDSLAESIM